MNNCPIYMPDGRPAPPLLTTDETTEILRLRECGCGKPEYTLQRLKDSGRLCAVRITRKSAYRLADVMAYVEGLS